LEDHSQDTMASRNGEFLLFDALPFFCPLRSTCCGEGVLGWWVRQAGSAQTLTTCPRLPPSMTMASAIFAHGFWLADNLVIAPFVFGFLISNSTY
jgi:hypothetical protein